jgi:hypothetical protein
MTQQSSNTRIYLQIKFGVNEIGLHTTFGTILIVWNMEAVHIGKGVPAKTSMKHPEELAKVRHPRSQGMNNSVHKQPQS